MEAVQVFLAKFFWVYVEFRNVFAFVARRKHDSKGLV
jgi:hypothetical protein